MTQRHWYLELQDLLTARPASALPVLDFGIGQPDGDPPSTVASTFDSAEWLALHPYPQSFGAPHLRQTVATWLERRQEIQISAEAVTVTHGSKLPVALAPLMFTKPGDTVVVPTPGYTTYAMAVRQSGRVVRWLHLSPEAGFIPSEASLETAFKGAAMAYLNFPNNPTGAVADLAALSMMVGAAKRHGTTIVHDAAYLELAHEQTAPSIFRVPGAAAVAVELHSFSKTFHLAGWRIGFAIASGDRLTQLRRVMSASDTGASRAAQRLAERVLDTVPNFGEERRERDKRRTGKVARALAARGWQVFSPSAAFYVWFRPAPGVTWARIVTEAGIACAPGEAFGPAGKGWIRLSCVADERACDTMLERLERL